MSVMTAEPVTAPRSYRDLLRTTPWTTVLALGVLIAFVDGFAMISLRGAVGFIGRTQGPFGVWMLHSTLQLPLFVAAVWGAYALARHLGRGRLGRRPALLTALLVTSTTTLVSLVLTAVNAVYDYQLQVKQMTEMMASGMMATGMQAQLEESVTIQFVALGVASIVYVVANLFVTGWVAALRGGRLGAISA